MKIILLIRSLNVGGTERQLITLAKGFSRRGIDVHVVLFYGGGVLERELREDGIHVVDLKKRGRWDVIGFLVRAARAVWRLKPEIIYSFLGTANALASLLRLLRPGVRIVWGVRAAYVDLNQYDWLSRASYRVERCIAWSADLIICNSWSGMAYAAAHGFPKTKLRVVPNGIDVERFKPDLAARARIREEFAVRKGDQLIGLVGRLDPIKDHPTFLRAAALLEHGGSACRFMIVGDGPPDYERELRKLAADLGLGASLIWCGSRSDMPAVFNALDVACSSSYGEGFSNVIAEAMACGVPCVVTDVGDSAAIVEGTGSVVPPRAPAALCDALRLMLLTAHDRRAAARASIVNRFTNEALVNNTLELLCHTE